jgi:hypothetical protein
MKHSYFSHFFFEAESCKFTRKKNDGNVHNITSTYLDKYYHTVFASLSKDCETKEPILIETCLN